MAEPLLATERILDDLHITGPRDLRLLELIALARHAVVQEGGLEGATGRLLVVGQNAVITVSQTIASPQRKRFTIAHELGHLELERGDRLTLCADGDIVEGKGPGDQKPRERAANEFASALLLPERFVAPLCEKAAPSLDLAAELAEMFDVSLTATAIRYTRFCREPCAVVFSQDGNIKWFQPSLEFADLGLFIPAPGPLDPASLAALLFRKRSIPRTPQRIKAAYWFEPGGYQEGATILEQSWEMPRYSAVLTLLWVDDDIQGDDFYWQ